MPGIITDSYLLVISSQIISAGYLITCLPTLSSQLLSQVQQVLPYFTGLFLFYYLWLRFLYLTSAM